MKPAGGILPLILALAVPCLAQESPRPAYKQEQSLDAPPPPPRGSLYLQHAPAPADGDAAAGGQPAVSHGMSFIDVPAEEPKKYRKHDIVTIVVSEDSESSTTGQGQNKKTQDFNAQMQQFVKLGANNMGLPSIQQQTNPNALPQAQFTYSNDRENNALQTRTDHLAGRIAATIVDIKPNGTLVLEATKNIQSDKETQTFRLTGICKTASIKGDSVLSTEIAELSLSKTTTGEVRNGTKSGWFNSLWDKISPF